MELTRNRLTEIFARYADLKIALVGDLFLDQWFEIDPSLNEISLETGKTAHQVVGRRTSPGAGGNVLSNLAAMGAGKLWAISLIGHDGGGWELLRLLKERGIDVSRILWSDAVMTPSYIKPMNPTEGERFDLKNFTTTPTELENELIDRLQDPKNLQNVPKNLPILIVSGEEDPVGDYGKGPKLTLESLQKYGAEDVTLKLYPGLRHETLNEDAREEVKEDLYQWIMSKI